MALLFSLTSKSSAADTATGGDDVATDSHPGIPQQILLTDVISALSAFRPSSNMATRERAIRGTISLLVNEKGSSNGSKLGQLRHSSECYINIRTRYCE